MRTGNWPSQDKDAVRWVGGGIVEQRLKGAAVMEGKTETIYSTAPNYPLTSRTNTTPHQSRSESRGKNIKKTEVKVFYQPRKLDFILDISADFLDIVNLAQPKAGT